MGCYAILAYIELPFSKENIQSILKKAESIGCTFLLHSMDDFDPKLYKLVSLSEATNAVFYGIPDPDMHVITLKYQDTYLNLSVSKGGTQMALIFVSFMYPWYRKENDQETDELDLVRYLRLMLDLIENYQLIELHVEKD